MNPPMTPGGFFSQAPPNPDQHLFPPNHNGGRQEPAQFFAQPQAMGVAPMGMGGPGLGMAMPAQANALPWVSAPQPQPQALPQPQLGGYSGGLFNNQQPPLAQGVNAFGSNAQGNGYAYVGNAGPTGTAEQAQQAHNWGGWAAKPQLTFGFNGQAPQAATPYANGGSNAFRPPQQPQQMGMGLGLGGATFGTASMPRPGLGTFGFTGAAQHSLSRPLNGAPTPFAAPLFGSPSLTAPPPAMSFGNSPFAAASPFAWNMKSFEQGVTGLSNYEMPASQPASTSSWGPQARPMPPGYGLSNWGQWNGVSSNYSFARPADMGRSVMGQWNQPPSLFGPPVAPPNGGLLARSSTASFADPQRALWGGGMPGGYATNAPSVFTPNCLERQARAMLEECRVMGIPCDGRNYVPADDPWLRPVVYRKATAEEEAEAAEARGEEVGPVEGVEQWGQGMQEEPEMHRTVDPYQEAKMLRLALPTC